MKEKAAARRAEVYAEGGKKAEAEENSKATEAYLRQAGPLEESCGT